MIVLHHLANSRSQRILWLLEELGAPYRVAFYERNPATRAAPDSLRKIHPLGKSPIVSDGDVIVAESGLIVEYLCNRFPDIRLAPARDIDEIERLNWAYWLHYAEGSAMTPLLLDLLLSGINDAAVEPLKSGFLKRELTAHTDYWETTLAPTGYFSGPTFSAADLMMTFPIEAAARFGYIDGRIRCRTFLDRMQSRDAYRRAQEAGIKHAL